MDEFGIPYFVIFDEDRSTSKKDHVSHSQSSKLKKLLNIPVVNSNFEIGTNFCVFEEDFEHTFRQLYPNWADLDTEAKQVIGAKGNTAKSLRAKYASRRVASLLMKKDSSVEQLRSFMTSLCIAIKRQRR